MNEEHLDKIANHIPVEPAQQTAAVNQNMPEVQPDLSRSPVALTEDQAKIGQLMAEINMADTKSILFFGSKAQEQLTVISDKMLEGCKKQGCGSCRSVILMPWLQQSEALTLMSSIPTKNPAFFPDFGQGKTGSQISSAV